MTSAPESNEAARWRSGIMRLEKIKTNLKKSNIQLCFHVLWPFLAFFSVIHGVTLHKSD